MSKKSKQRLLDFYTRKCQNAVRFINRRTKALEDIEREATENIGKPVRYNMRLCRCEIED